MQISPRGVAYIRDKEKLRLDSYQDSAGKWTIGYGHTGPEVGPNQTITEDEANARWDKDIAKFSKGVAEKLRNAPTQNQFDALVSLAYNIGSNAFGGSTVLKEFNKGNMDRARAGFGLFDKVTNPKTKKLEVNQGLVVRRAEEAGMFSLPHDIRPTRKPPSPQPDLIMDYVPPEPSGRLTTRERRQQQLPPSPLGIIRDWIGG